MKRIIIISILLIGVQYLLAQNNHVGLDIAPYVNTELPVSDIRAPFDSLFVYPMPEQYITTGAETDGNFYYVGAWYTPDFLKYDMQGNFIEAFTIPGVASVKDMAYDGEYFYSNTSGYASLNVLDLENKILVQSLTLPFDVRAIAYNDDLDVFYANDWSDDIKVFQPDGTVIDTIPISYTTHTYLQYYGFAYDNWTDGGPFLWAFSQDGPSMATLVQLSLPSGDETGFYMDLGFMSLESTYAGGLFTYPDYDSGIAIIAGIMQNVNMFGLELAPITPPPASYDIGGNLSANATSLDEGEVNLYRIDEGSVEEQFTTGVDNSGNYLFTEMVEGDYMIHAKPEAGSITADDYVPTYHDGNIHWEDVSIVYISENSLENNIELVEMSELGNGIGFVNGHVYDISSENEPPVVNAQVMLMNASGECIAVAYTDEEGSFAFNDIALESYGLIVEIPGKVMEPMSFLLTEPEPGLTGVILYVTDESIMVGLDEQHPSWIKSITQIYPNPPKEQAYFNIDMDVASIARIKIHTASGQLLQQNQRTLDKGQNKITIITQTLSKGIYYVTIEINKEYALTRKLIKIE